MQTPSDDSKKEIRPEVLLKVEEMKPGDAIPVRPVAAPPVMNSEDSDMPLPEDPRILFLGGLFLLSLLTAMYFAKEVVLPFVLAFMLKLLLQPAVRIMEDLRIPRVIAILISVLVLGGLLAVFGTILISPAVAWMQKLPTVLPHIQQKLIILREPFGRAQHAMEQIQSLAPGSKGTNTAVVQQNELGTMLLSGVRAFASGMFETVLLLFFLLASADTFLRRVVEILPRFRDKRQAVDISQQIEHDISVYLVTISGMNLLVGIATALVMWICGLGDPLLWGALAFFLNYLPILGPFCGVGIFLAVGLLTSDQLWSELMPAICYLAIHILEGELVTPWLLARHFTLNPVMIILSILFWYWMWGVPGAVLAVPMLAIIKIICDRIRPLMAIGHFLEG